MSKSNMEVIKSLLERFKPWKTKDGELYVDFTEGERRCSMSVRSSSFKSAVGAAFLQKGIVPTDYLINGTVMALQWHAMSAPTIDTGLRLCQVDDVLYYDLGDNEWTCARFAGGKWELTTNGPRFARGDGMRQQVQPIATSTSLREFLSRFIRAEDRTLRLCEAWLIGALKPGGPYPILTINGEQGSAKSTTSRLLRRLIDPHGRDLREPPTNARDLVAAAKHSHVLAFDNVSRIPTWLSDSFCRLATGTGAIGGRALYTDNDEAAFVACRPILLNGIPDFVEREDLADRSITIHLPAIEPRDRRDDDTYWSEVDAVFPQMLGALFNRVATAHVGFAGVVLAEKPRMSNFARWVVAGLGKEAGDFVDVLKDDRREHIESGIEHDVVAQALIDLLEERGRFDGTLLDLVRALRPKYQGAREWHPDTSLKLSNRLRRMQPLLRAAGIDVQRIGREGGTGRSKVLIRRAENPDRTFAVSAVH